MTTPAVSFTVAGTPASMGSMTATFTIKGAGRPKTGMVRVEDILAFVRPANSVKLSAWQGSVSRAAAKAMAGCMPIAGPLEVRLTFYFQRPPSHTRAQRLVPWYAPKGRDDIEKLVRSTFDAMTDAAVWEDDGQVARVEASSVYADSGKHPGAWVAVFRLWGE